MLTASGCSPARRSPYVASLKRAELARAPAARHAVPACSAAAWRRSQATTRFARGRAAGDRGGADRAIGHRRGRRATRTSVALGVGTCATVAVVAALATGLALCSHCGAVARGAPPHVTRTLITPSGPAALSINARASRPCLRWDAGRLRRQQRHAALRPRPRRARTGKDRQRRGLAESILLTGWSVGRLRRRQRLERSRSPAARPSRSPSATAPRAAPRGARRHDHLLDLQPDNRAAARVGHPGGTPEVLTRPDHAQAKPTTSARILPAAASSSSRSRHRPAASIRIRWRCAICTRERKKCCCTTRVTRTTWRAATFFFAAGTLRAIRFDLTRLETRGTEVPVLPRLATNLIGGACFDVAPMGPSCMWMGRETSRRKRARSCGSTAPARNAGRCAAARTTIPACTRRDARRPLHPGSKQDL